MKWAATLLAVLLALAVPAGAQRPDGFGGRGPSWTVEAPSQERSLQAMGACHFQGYFKSASGQVFDAWLCTSGAIVLWPTACTDDPSNPCKET